MEKFLLEAAFQVNRISRTNLVRLNADGKVDLSFDAGGGANGPIHTVAVLKNGNVLVGGDFSQVNGVPRVGVARLSGGAVDYPSRPRAEMAHLKILLTKTQSSQRF